MQPSPDDSESRAGLWRDARAFRSFIPPRRITASRRSSVSDELRRRRCFSISSWRGLVVKGRMNWSCGAASDKGAQAKSKMAASAHCKRMTDRF